jgi:hypothetical protein
VPREQQDGFAEGQALKDVTSKRRRHRRSSG